MKETEATGNWAKRFDYKYLGSNALTDGQQPTVTIKRITDASGAKVQGQTKDVTLMYLAEFDVPMILNKVNCAALTWNFGTKSFENWIGKSAVLFSDPDVDAFGTKVEALRFVKNKVRGIFDASGVPTAPKKKTLDLTSTNFEEWKAWLGKPTSTLAAVIEKFAVTEAALEELKKIKSP